MLTCALGEYTVGTTVLFYENVEGDFQKMMINNNGTISPIKAPDMVFGMKACSEK